MYENDERTVLTLDAGGTNFVFSAIQGCREAAAPVRMPAITDDLDKCLLRITEGFSQIRKQLKSEPAAISFAFPGPADYEAGIIGDLPNFKCFRGGVALGPYLSDKFGIPVHINNDGNLFAYGEAIAGFLPATNAKLAEAGNPKQYRNLVGVTLGTGFGGGVVIDGRLLTGDNGCGGDVWLMRNKKYPEMICEESVSIRAVKRVYAELTGEKNPSLNPKDIFDIAEGTAPGDPYAARRSFEELGEMAADAIVRALDIVDGLVVIGGGISAASKYIIPGMMSEMRRKVGVFSGESFPCLQMEAFDLSDEADLKEFLKDDSSQVAVPFSEETVRYSFRKKIGVGVSALGTSHAISVGAYAVALAALDAKNE